MKHSQVCHGGLARFVALKTMDELCPLCLKMGNNKRIKAVQINLEEAVWICENEECPWPFGYETPVFLPRKVGSKHSNEWEVYKKVQKHVGPIPVSTELSLYTPPVTPSSDTITKESTKSDFSGETNISEHFNEMGNILRCTNDSYAPKLNPRDNQASNDITKEMGGSNTCVENQAPGSCSVVPKAPIPQSIFDIDSKELPGDKIIAEDFCSEPEKPDSLLASLEILDVKNSEKPIETVLKVSGNEIGSEDKKLEDVKIKIVKEEMGEVGSIKTLPQVTKISEAKIDLHVIDRREVVEMKKSVENEEKDSLEGIKSDLTEIIETKDSAIRIDNNSEESEVSSKPPTLDDTPSPRQHTTTITLDGSLPITLSYDLTDLEGKFEDKVPQTSPKVRDDSMVNCQAQGAENPAIKSPVRLAKNRIRPPAKRRAALSGKHYEKFSFSALKKCPGNTKDCGHASSSTIVSSNLRVNLEDSQIVNVHHSPISDPHDSMDTRILEASNQPIESPNLGNVDSVVSGKNNDEPIVENLNLNVLDDFLLDSYQNATDNLNDDWLESFFTNLDT